MILTPDVCNAQGMLARLDAGISWCRMSFKPKSRSLSILDSEVAAKTFSVAGQAIPYCDGRTCQKARQVV